VNEIILYANTLPEPLLGLIGTEKVRVSKSCDAIIMIPVKEDIDYIEYLYGSCVDSGLTIDKFLEWTREDKEIEE
jgi:hypothetical protein